VALVLVLALAGMAPATVARAAQARGTPGSRTITIASPLPQVGTLSASARYVAWTATKLCSGDVSAQDCSPQVLYLYDLMTGQLRVAARTAFGATGAIYHYNVSDRWLVYLDTGIRSSPSVLAWRIVVMDLLTGKATALAQSSDADVVAVPPDLSLAGSTLVWTSGHPLGVNRVESVVSVTDLATRSTRVVARTATPYSFSFPSTDGRRVVWEQDDYTSAHPSSRILGTDLGGPLFDVHVLSRGTFASEPAVRGDGVVWKSGPGYSAGQIMLSSWPGTAAPQLLSGLEANAVSPVIGDGFVAWATGSAGRVTIYDLRSGRLLSPGGTRRGWIYGFPTAVDSWVGYPYMTGVPRSPSGGPPRGFITLQYLGPDAARWTPSADG
jgi:hypothetical protein